MGRAIGIERSHATHIQKAERLFRLRICFEYGLEASNRAVMVHFAYLVYR